MIATIKGYYYLSQAHALDQQKGIHLPLTPRSRVPYTAVFASEKAAEQYNWPDKKLVDIGPLLTEVWEGREVEQWEGEA